MPAETPELLINQCTSLLLFAILYINMYSTNISTFIHHINNSISAFHNTCATVVAKSNTRILVYLWFKDFYFILESSSFILIYSSLKLSLLLSFLL